VSKKYNFVPYALGKFDLSASHFCPISKSLRFHFISASKHFMKLVQVLNLVSIMSYREVLRTMSSIQSTDPDACVCLALLLPKSTAAAASASGNPFTDPPAQSQTSLSALASSGSLASGGSAGNNNSMMFQVKIGVTCGASGVEEVRVQGQDKRGVPAGGRRSVGGGSLSSERLLGPFSFMAWSSDFDAVVLDGVCSLRDLHNLQVFSARVCAI